MWIMEEEANDRVDKVMSHIEQEIQKILERPGATMI